MTRTYTSGAALWVAVIAAVLLAACDRGPAGPQGETGLTGPPGQTLDWSDTIADANLADSVYAIGWYGPAPSASGSRPSFYHVGTGFSAHYHDVIWTNGHVADALQDLLFVTRGTRTRSSRSWPTPSPSDPARKPGGEGTYSAGSGKRPLPPWIRPRDRDRGGISLRILPCFGSKRR